MKKMMACIDLKNISLKSISNYLSDYNWTHTNELHLIHGFLLQTFSDGFYIDTYPLEKDYKEIVDSAIKTMDSIEIEIFKNNNILLKPKIIKECFITSSPKNKLANYSNEKGIDIMLIATRGKHGIKGLFSSSFARFMLSHVKAELRIIRSE